MLIKQNGVAIFKDATSKNYKRLNYSEYSQSFLEFPSQCIDFSSNDWDCLIHASEVVKRDDISRGLLRCKQYWQDGSLWGSDFLSRKTIDDENNLDWIRIRWGQYETQLHNPYDFLDCVIQTLRYGRKEKTINTLNKECFSGIKMDMDSDSQTLGDCIGNFMNYKLKEMNATWELRGFLEGIEEYGTLSI